MVQASAAKAPTSVRAQTQYAMLLFNAGLPDEGMRVLDEAILNIPGDHPALLMHRLSAKCNLGVLERAELERIAGTVSSIPFDPRMLKIYNEFAKAVVLQRCPGVRVADVLPMFVNMLALRENSDPASIQYTHIRFLIGYTRLYMGEVNGAMAEFKESLASRPGASYAMAMAALLATTGFPAQALELSDIALTQLETKNNTTLVGQRATEADIRAFQETVRAELALQQGADTPGPGE
jgi:tetratricopeptide (TPR) repeat protein